MSAKHITDIHSVKTILSRWSHAVNTCSIPLEISRIIEQMVKETDVHEGFLLYKIDGSWRKRFFVLSNWPELRYYAAERRNGKLVHKAKLCGSIDLMSVPIIRHGDQIGKNYHYSIDLVTADHIHTLATLCKNLRDMWTNKLCAAMYGGVGMKGLLYHGSLWQFLNSEWIMGYFVVDVAMLKMHNVEHDGRATTLDTSIFFARDDESYKEHVESMAKESFSIEHAVVKTHDNDDARFDNTSQAEWEQIAKRNVPDYWEHMVADGYTFRDFACIFSVKNECGERFFAAVSDARMHGWLALLQLAVSGKGNW